MGLEQFSGDKITLHPDMTIQELVDEYGEESVRRGVKYMQSLSEADRKFRESSDKADKYAENMTKGLMGSGNVESDKPAERWKEGMSNGIGLDNE